MHDELVCYGAKLSSDALGSTLDHILQTNLRRQDAGQPATPVCIWGPHGLGKTTLVRDYAAARGWQFAYCAPAQFEEMGDLHGLPTRVQADDGTAQTAFLPPDWVPRSPGPGILLLDDLNRADDRILRGLMQLLQNFEMFSWRLPERWQIVATANPEGGDYSVTPLDDAMLTRLLHLTLVWDVRAWARWATDSGVDPRGVDFVLTYPEVVTGRRTTPRSLTQFFEQIEHIDDLQAQLELVTTLALSSLDQVTVSAFVAYVSDNLAQLVQPEEILGAHDWDAVDARLHALAGSEDARRVDRLATVCTRLVLALSASTYVPHDGHGPNLVRFLLHPTLPSDLRFSTHQDLVQAGPQVREMMRDPRIVDALLPSL